MLYLKLLRPAQWYKNLLVFLPLIFSGNLSNIAAIGNSFLAFLAFCALASATYVINDYADRHNDRLNPEKCKRPIASGDVGFVEALLIAVLLFSAGISISFLLPIFFIYSALGYFVLSQLYTAWFKHEAFADVIAISCNFVLRAVGGALAIQVWTSPWLIIGVFFLAFFLAVGKRRAELSFLQDFASLHRRVFSVYTSAVLDRLGVISTSALIISYALYVFFSSHNLLFLTLPPAIYSVLLYDSFVIGRSRIARSPELVFSDARFVFALLLWLGIVVLVIYGG